MTKAKEAKYYTIHTNMLYRVTLVITIYDLRVLYYSTTFGSEIL